MKRMIVAAMLLAGTAYAADKPDTMAVPDYRCWVFLTSSMDLNYQSAEPATAHMMDNVFVDPAAYKVFLKTGTWPDKTVLVKENRNAASAGTLSKGGEFQTNVVSVEFHVKDTKHFKGDWGFYASADGKKTAAFQPMTASCYACHQAHAAVDTTFVQFYPTLIAIAKAHGTWHDTSK